MISPQPSMEELAPVVRGNGSSDANVTDAYLAHSGELYSFLLQVTRDQHAAEDLLQEVFLKLLAETRSGRRPERARPWLYRVATNLALSRGRRLAVAARHLGGLLNRETAPSPDEHVIRRESDAVLHAALSKMPAAARAALLLRSHGLSSAEVAAALGRTEGATRTLLCRSRVQLRLLLEQSGAQR